MVVTENDIEIGLVEDKAEDFHRVTRDADEADLAGLLDFTEFGNGFVDDLLHGDELDIVTEDDIEMIGAETMEADINAFPNAFGGEIKMLEVVAAELGAEEVLLARDIAQGDTEENFAHAAAIKGRGIDEVEAAIEGDADAANGFVQGDGAKFLAKGGGPKAEDREMKSSFTEQPCLHGEILSLTAAEGKQNVGPKRLIAGLDGEDVVG